MLLYFFMVFVLIRNFELVTHLTQIKEEREGDPIQPVLF